MVEGGGAGAEEDEDEDEDEELVDDAEALEREAAEALARAEAFFTQVAAVFSLWVAPMYTPRGPRRLGRFARRSLSSAGGGRPKGCLRTVRHCLVIPMRSSWPRQCFYLVFPLHLSWPR